MIQDRIRKYSSILTVQSKLYSVQLQRRGERRATINEEVGGVYDVKVLYRGYVQLTNTKNSKTNVYTFVLHRARLKSIMHPWRPTW